MLQDLANTLHGASMAPFYVHQSAKLESGKIIRLKAPLHLPFCDTHIQGRNIYVQIVLFFSMTDKKPMALALPLKNDTRVTNAQVQLASLKALRPSGLPLLLQLAEVIVEIPIVPSFSSSHEDAFLLNHFAV